MTLREDADFIIKEAIRHVLPDEAVRKALEGKAFGQGRLYLVAAGKAAWQKLPGCCWGIGWKRVL